jgi:hypothetical protein
MKRTFPLGCYIGEFRRPSEPGRDEVYATLRHPDGSLMISSTLDYIVSQLQVGEFVPVADYRSGFHA